MNLKQIIHFVGTFVVFLGLTLIAPIICSVIYGENNWGAFFAPMCVTIGLGLIMNLSTRVGINVELEAKESFVIVALCWLSACIMGAVPYMLTGALKDFANAFFESVSGFTTTGSSVIADVEAQSHAILLWRGLTHWLGGMGIIVLAIAILPFLNVGGLKLLNTEAASLKSEKLKPRIISTVRSLWGIYMLLSFSEALFLILAGMPIFDSITHMFATIATGGFSVKNAGIAAYKSPLIEFIIISFMFLSSTNFVIHYYLLSGNYKKVLSNTELKFFISVVALSIAVITLNIWGSVYGNILTALRHAAFYVVSLISTTGFSTVDYTLWPPLSQWILFLLLFIGGCTGSTCGAIKCMRVYIILKKIYLEILHIITPRAIFPLRAGNEHIPRESVSEVTSFVLLYLVTFTVASLCMMGLGVNILTSLSSVAATMGGVGPGLDKVGPVCNYAWMTGTCKYVLSSCMLLGRLELFTIFVLLVPSFWKE